jgi:hypothetical protein
MTLSPPARRILLPVLTVTVTAVLAVGFFPLALWTSFLAAAVWARLYVLVFTDDVASSNYPVFKGPATL